MKHRLLPLGIIVLGLLAFGTYPANGQTTAIGPYYATPSWDQKLKCDTQATCPRFVVLSNWNNEAVLDRETGLVWERYPEGEERSWFSARTKCNGRIVGNRGGWRLPTLPELNSLADYSPTNPSVLPAGHPFIGVQRGIHWSASILATTNDAWNMDFFFGFVYHDDTSVPLFVWCVRGGQGIVNW